MTIMNDLKFDRTVSAAFTGHRFYDFSQREFIQERLTSAISEAYDHGIRNFISGFALGIDLMAAQLVQSLKCNLPGISLTAAIPFEGQAERYNIYDKRGRQIRVNNRYSQEIRRDDKNNHVIGRESASD